MATMWYVGVVRDREQDNLFIYNPAQVPAALVRMYREVFSSNGNREYRTSAERIDDIVERLVSAGAKCPYAYPPGAAHIIMTLEDYSSLRRLFPKNLAGPAAARPAKRI